MDNHSLNDALFASVTPTVRCNAPQASFSKSTPPYLFPPVSSHNKSDNETHEDLAGMVQGIPVPSDDELCHGSLDSGTTSENTTPQRRRNSRPFNRISRRSSALFEEFNHKALSDGLGRSTHSQNPAQLDFENNMTIEELASMESPGAGHPINIENWSKKNVILGIGNNVFPTVEASSIDLSGNDFLHQSKRNIKPKCEPNKHIINEDTSQGSNVILERNIHEMQRMRQHIDYLNSQIRIKNEEVAHIKSNYEGDKIKLASLTAYMSEMSEAVDKTNQQMEDDTREIEELKEFNGRLIEQQQVLNQEIGTWKQKYSLLREDLVKNTDSKDKETLEMKTKYQEATVELNTKTDQLKKIRDEYQALQSKYQTKSLAEKTHWEQVKTSLSEKVRALDQNNKTLTEMMKSLKEEQTALKIEVEKKEKTIAQKDLEMKSSAQANKLLCEDKQDLINEVNGLKVIIQQLEEMISVKKIQSLHDEITLNETSSHYNEGEATRESERLRGDVEFVSKGKQDLERLLTNFSERQIEFDNIKQSFIDKTMTLNEKIESYKQTCLTLTEENDSLTAQVNSYKNIICKLNEKVDGLENNLKQASQRAPLADPCPGLVNNIENQNHTRPSIKQPRISKELAPELGLPNSNAGCDELIPPPNYEENPLKYASYNNRRGDHRMKPVIHSSHSEANNESNCSVLDMISPEMLSTEDTISLMLEVLKRTTESHKLSVRLGRDMEFKELTNMIRKHVAIEDMNRNDYATTNGLTFRKSGRKH